MKLHVVMGSGIHHKEPLLKVGMGLNNIKADRLGNLIRYVVCDQFVALRLGELTDIHTPVNFVLVSASSHARP